MNTKKYIQVAIAVLALVTVTAITLIIATAFTTKQNAEPTKSNSAIQGVAAAAPTSPSATATAVTTPVTTLPVASTTTAVSTTAAAPTIATLPTLVTAYPNISLTDLASVPMGQVIPMPNDYAKYGELRIIRATGDPLISMDDAIKAFAAQVNYNYKQMDPNATLPAPGSDLTNLTDQGRTVKVTMTYGLVTQGSPSPAGWTGSVNIELVNCTADGKCTGTGKYLDHFDNRPVWIFDLDGQHNQASGPNAKVTTHVVFGIDAQTHQYYGFLNY